MEQELTIKQILAIIIRKRKIVLVCALAAALLLGGYRAWSLSNELRDTEKLALESQKAETEQELYERKQEALINTISNLEKQRDEAVDYISTSPLMQVDPYHKKIARLSLSVEIDEAALGMTTGERSADDMRSRIAGRYYVLACAMPLAEIAREINTAGYSEESLGELLSVAISIDGCAELRSAVWMPVSDTLQITATTVEGLDGAAFLTAIHSYLVGQQAVVAESTVPHELRVLDQSEAVVVDSPLITWQQEWINAVSVIVSNITIEQKELTALKAPVASAVPTLSSAPAQTAKYALLGLLVGAALGGVFVFFLEAMRNRLRDADQLRSCLKQRYLGNLQPSRKGDKRKLDLLADRLDGCDDFQALDERLVFASTSIKAAADGKKSLLLVGTLPAEVLEAGAKALNEALEGTEICVRIGGDVNRNSGAIEKLADADGVILAERAMQSRCDEIVREVDRLNEMGIEPLGFVLI